MDDDNIFDNDDALDYIIYADVADDNSGNKKSGCLALLIVLLVPMSLLKLWL